MALNLESSTFGLVANGGSRWVTVAHLVLDELLDFIVIALLAGVHERCGASLVVCDADAVAVCGVRRRATNWHVTA